MVRKTNKKGDFGDLLLIMVIVVVFGFVILIGYKINDSINDKFQSNAEIDNNQSKAAMNEINNHFTGVLDNSFLLLVVGLIIVVFFLASRLNIHPIFIALFVIIISIVIFLVAIFSNLYLEVANQTDMATQADELTFTTHVIWRLPLILGVVGFILAFIMYKNWRENQ